MVISELSTLLEKLVNQICEENGFSDYIINVENGSNIGDGFASQLVSIKIVERNSEKKLDLVCKLAPSNLNHRKEFRSDVMFDREATFYNKVVPTFYKFQQEKNLPKEDQFLSYPKCFAAVVDHKLEEYVIILEDLRPQGFKLWDKSKVASIEGARLTIREIAKFHAISIAMKEQKPHDFAECQKITDFIQNVFKSEKLIGMANASFDRAINSLIKDSHKNVMIELKENMMEHFSFILTENSKFAVLSHGDFWCNNYLFQIDGNGIPEDVRILDWQVIRYVSPVIDVLFNIFSSTDKTLRDKEYDNLIQLYYDTLSKTVKLLGSNPDDLFSFNELQTELKRCGNYALIFAPIVIQTVLADTSELVSLDDLFDGDADSRLEFIAGLNEKAQQKYNQRLNDLLEDFIRLGYTRKVDEY